MFKTISLKSFVAVCMSAFLLLAVGCASVGGGSVPQSSDVTADVLTERNILKAINDDPGLDASLVGVSCINGVVTLRGSVGSNIERLLAEKVALKVSGVSKVTNLLSFN